jgi:L-methionine (R)-S-oxide reductase
MSDGIDLPRVARGTVLPEDERVARLEYASPQILAALAGEHDPIVLQSTLASLLWETFAQASWVGFYRRTGERVLSVGPYQGPMGCLHIDFDRGVCGACARTASVQLVPDVREFAGHIACDDTTLSELVVPVFGREIVQAVLDLDARSLDAFSAAEAVRLEKLLGEAFDAHVRWASI